MFETKTGQFIVVVEGRPGLGGFPVGVQTTVTNPADLPAVQVQNVQPLGNGSPAVCDTGPPSVGGGGVPGINPPSFDVMVPAYHAAIRDLGCRFQAFSPSSACTILDLTRESRTVSPLATQQFCNIVAATATFPPGENVVTARLADVLGRTGPTKQIVVRVATPSPTP